LRREIKVVASEYDVEWDEKLDEGSEEVHDALKEERRKERNSRKDDDDEEGGGDTKKGKSG
jgi:hypothetical protein